LHRLCPKDKTLAERCIGKGHFSRRSLCAHFAPISIKLISKHLRKRSVRALAEINVRRIEGDRVIGCNFYPASKGGFACLGDHFARFGCGTAIHPMKRK
jgi:hypothetical protein